MTPTEAAEQLLCLVLYVAMVALAGVVIVHCL